MAFPDLGFLFVRFRETDRGIYSSLFLQDGTPTELPTHIEPG